MGSDVNSPKPQVQVRKGIWSQVLLHPGPSPADILQQGNALGGHGRGWTTTLPRAQSRRAPGATRGRARAEHCPASCSEHVRRKQRSGTPAASGKSPKKTKSGDSATEGGDESNPTAAHINASTVDNWKLPVGTKYLDVFDTKMPGLKGWPVLLDTRISKKQNRSQKAPMCVRFQAIGQCKQGCLLAHIAANQMTTEARTKADNLFKAVYTPTTGGRSSGKASCHIPPDDSSNQFPPTHPAPPPPPITSMPRQYHVGRSPETTRTVWWDSTVPRAASKAASNSTSKAVQHLVTNEQAQQLVDSRLSGLWPHQPAAREPRELSSTTSDRTSPQNPGATTEAPRDTTTRKGRDHQAVGASTFYSDAAAARKARLRFEAAFRVSATSAAEGVKACCTCIERL